MPAPRTVDENGKDKGNTFVGVRLSGSQEIKLDQLCEAFGLTRSKMLRKLIQDTWETTMSPAEMASDPF